MATHSEKDRAVQTHLQGMDDELQSAINTLVKLRAFTVSLAGPDAPLFEPDLASAPATLEIAKSSSLQGNVANLPHFSGRADLQQVRALVTGESFGRYQISRALGRGGMGAVYLAYDSELERYVALKTPFVGENPLAVERFHREARSAAKIRSPYVCPIYDVGNVSGILYFTMAFIEGRSLSEWIKVGPRTLDESMEVFRKIAVGVQKAHAQSIIHRDLKPDSVMIDEQGDPIIMDFGLARRADDEQRLTSDGGILGTPAYMSPEQIRGNQDQVGPESDIYSLGVVLYEILTGRVPFEGSIISVLHKVLREEPQPPSARQPKLLPGSPIEQICLKMLSKTRTDRYSCMGEVLAALDDLTSSLVLTPTPMRMDTPRQRSQRLLALFTDYLPRSKWWGSSMRRTVDLEGPPI